jgi:predicted transcriptional regulator
MLKKEKEEAIKLREKGLSINEIARFIGVAKSSVSLWVRNVKLNFNQIDDLAGRKYKREFIEKRRETRLKNEIAKRQITIDAAKKEIRKLSEKELWLIGVMLYWAEGGKTQRLVRFSNGDPEMIKIMMAFFRKICKVREEKFRGYIHIHPHLNHKKAERYWSSISGISLKKFFKTYRKINVSSKNKKDTLPFGVMDIYICDTELFLKISGWARGIFDSY